MERIGSIYYKYSEEEYNEIIGLLNQLDCVDALEDSWEFKRLKKLITGEDEY